MKAVYERIRVPLAALVGAAVLATVLLAPRDAAATSGFVSQIRSELDAPSTPSCALCHATPAGGGPVAQPFGQSMVARGLRAGNASSLTTALQALEAEGTDSDGDGLGDVEELRMGLDPNFEGDADTAPPEFGCGGHIAPRGPSGGVAMMAAFGVVVLLQRRRFARRHGRSASDGGREKMA